MSEERRRPGTALHRLVSAKTELDVERYADESGVRAQPEDTSLDVEVTRADLGQDESPLDNGSAELEAGVTLGRYVILRRIGAGGIGVVYLAYDPELDRRIALKLIGTRARGKKLSIARARLVREARTMARLNHANVITIHDVGLVGTRVFIAMEFIDGDTLGGWLKRKPRTWQEIVEVFTAAGRGLIAVHDAGYIHRDFKPDNVMIASDGTVRVMDFGLVRGVGEEIDKLSSTGGITPGESALMDQAHALLTDDDSMTRTGLTMGTPAYMSPEQHTALTLDPRSDQFSYCVALYEALYKRRPFRGDTLPRLAQAVLAGSIVPPDRSAGVPKWLQKIVIQGLSSSREKRFPSMVELLEQLNQDPGRARRRWIAGLAVVAVAAVATAAVFEWQARKRLLCQDGEERLAGTWDDERKQALEARFIDTGVSFAATTWTRVARKLDERAEAWKTERADACMATRVHGVQSELLLDLRMQCYDRRLAELRALTEVLAEADALAVEKAVDATHRLAPLDFCSDVKALTSVNEPPSDPRARVEQVEIQTALARARALKLTGRQGDALTLLTSLAARAQAAGYAPTTADVMLDLASVQAGAGRFKEAEHSYLAAIDLASASGQDSGLVRGWSALAHLVGDDLGRPGDGLLYMGVAKSAVIRGGDKPADRLRVVHSETNLLYTLGRYEEAVTRGRKTLELTAEQDGEDDPEYARSMSNLANALDDMGEHEQARDLYEQALASLERSLGPDHPDIATVLVNLGATIEQLGEPGASLAHLRRALAIYEAVLGKDHRSSANTRVHIAMGLVGLGRDDEALTEFSTALDIWERGLGPDHPWLAYALVGIGRIELARGETGKAAEHMERALKIRESALGPKHAEYAETLADVAAVDAARGEWMTARTRFETATAAASETLKDDHHKLARMRFGLARATWETAGRKQAAEGVDPKAPAAEPTPAAVAADRARARELAQRARAALGAPRGRFEQERAAIDTWLETHKL